MEENKTAPECTEQIKEQSEDKKQKNEKKKSEIEALREEIKVLQDEAEKAKKEADDKYLRMAAEYDNFRRRSREEKNSAYESAMADTVAELLPILDNLERAAQFDDCEKVKEGLQMIAKSVDEVLTKLGVEKFGAPGDKFDPNLHNAVMHEDSEEYEEGEITDVFQKGYKKGNKIIRFAMVKSAN